MKGRGRRRGEKRGRPLGKKRKDNGRGGEEDEKRR
jgi:hypothetical protein